jgi:putative SOS response-associated peptidase YedK
MCGRFIQAAAGEAFARQFALPLPAVYAPRYNVAPSQNVLALRSTEDGGREWAWLRWGLIPAWSPEPRTQYSTINARAETVAEKPTYRQAFRQRRCLLPADGFYEWHTHNGRKQPYCIGLTDGAAFAFAGLWERWEREGQAVESCTIVVTHANECIAAIHDRMPVILPAAAYEQWLNPAMQTPERLLPLLQPYPADRMTRWPVSPEVNRPGRDGAQLTAPL